MTLSPGPLQEDRRSGQANAQSQRSFPFSVLVLSVPLGLVWRLAPLHLPAFAFKYGGSALWAAAVYGFLGTFLFSASPGRLVLLATVVTTAVEAFKRVYWEPLDRFRETLAGKLLLGRYFTWGALLAYWVALAVVWQLHRRWLARGAAHYERDTPGQSSSTL